MTSLFSSPLRIPAFSSPRSSAHPPRTPRSLLFLCLLLLFPTLARAQDLTPKAAPQQHPILITHAAIHTVSHETLSDAGLLFADGRIQHVFNTDDLSNYLQYPDRPKDLVVIDAKGKHVYPGLIAPYSQLGISEIQAVRQMQDTTETGDVTPEVRALTAVNPDSTFIPVTRSNGVLLAGVFPEGGLIPGTASVIRLDAWTSEEMGVLPAAGVVLRWPNMRTITAWWMDRSEEDQQKDIREQLERIAQVFDTAKAYADARQADPNTPIDLHWEAMRPLFEGRPGREVHFPGPRGETRGRIEMEDCPLFVFANDIDQINASIAFCLERHLKPVILGGRDAPLAADLLKQHNIPVIVLGTHVLPRRDDAPYDEGFTLPLRLHEAGVRFAIANADDTAHERNVPYSAATAARFGLPPDAALRSVTLSAAEILGIADRYGSLDSGKSATLILTSGDPLEVETKIERAFIDGREIDLSNKQTKLAEKYRERYKQTGDLKERAASGQQHAK
jgi:imidazolonepropionase-like amidohydrolase